MPEPASHSPPRLRAVRLRVRGRVQGVWYRGFVREQALARGLRGHARNLPDGSVEVVAEGEAGAVEELVAACHAGPPAAVVASLTREDETVREGPAGFRVL